MTIYVVLFVDLFLFYKRASRLLSIRSSNPLSTTSSSSSIISSIDSPNHKLEMVCEKSSPFQSTFIAPMQSTKQLSSQLLSSSSIGVSGNAGVNILSLMCTTQLSVGIPFSTQDLSSALEAEAVKSNLVLCG